MLGTTYFPGQPVKLRKEQRGLLGSPLACKGARGTVVARASGWSTAYDVQFSTGTLRVSARDLKPASATAGDLLSGAKIGLALWFGIPALIAMLKYFLLEHGTVSGLVAAAPGVLLDQVGQLLGVISAVGLPVVALVVAALWLHRRLR